MNSKRTLVILTVLVLPAMLLSACGSSAGNQAVIATSVAQTVQAQNLLTQQAQITPTNLSAAATDTAPALTGTVPPGETLPAPPTAPSNGGSANNFCTASASLAGETVPDGTIVSPGSVFTKTWRITNTGTCTWDSSWKIVYVSGDLLGAAGVFNFPQPAAPGQTVDVPMVLTAPQENGTYTGYWELESKWGAYFGVGDNNSPFWVSVVVGSGTPANSKTQTAYYVTNVSYDVGRTPAGGCATNVIYTISATISTNGPATVTYYWHHSDGYNSNKHTITFSEASSVSVNDSWSLHLGANNGDYWDQIIVISPTYQEFGHAVFSYLCH